MMSNLSDLAARCETPNVGGDTSKASELYISITIYGETLDFPPSLRSDAEIGQMIYMTGSTGCSKAGLEILQSENQELIKQFSTLVSRHCKPEARFALTDFIRKEYELLFTSSAIKDKIEFNGVSITPIGIITDKGMKLSSNGKTVNIEARGFDHFR